MRVLAMVFLLFGAAPFASCGDSDKGPSRVDTIKNEGTSPPASSPLSENEFQAILDDVLTETLALETYRSNASIEISAGGEELSFEMRLVFRAPADHYTQGQLGGQEFELLAVPPNVYLREDDGRWVQLDPNANQSLFRLASGRTLQELESLRTTLIDPELVGGPNLIEGVEHVRIRSKLDLIGYAEALPEGFVDPTDLASAEGVEANIDMWIEKDTDLLRRMDLTLEGDFGGTPGTLQLTTDYTDHNAVESFPNPDGTTDRIVD